MRFEPETTHSRGLQGPGTDHRGNDQKSTLCATTCEHSNSRSPAGLSRTRLGPPYQVVGRPVPQLTGHPPRRGDTSWPWGHPGREGLPPHWPSTGWRGGCTRQGLGGEHRPSRSTARPVNPPPARGEVRAPAHPLPRGPLARGEARARARARARPATRYLLPPRGRSAPAHTRPRALAARRAPAAPRPRACRPRRRWPPSPGSGARRRASPPFSAWRRPPRPPPVRAPASGSAAGAFLAGRGGTPGR